MIFYQIIEKESRNRHQTAKTAKFGGLIR